LTLKPNRLRFAGSGAVAGAFSAFAFTIVHNLAISDIWFSLPAMLAAGALSGACVGWSHALLVGRPTLGSWLRYNLLYLAMFALLGAASVLIFEPATTLGAVLRTREPPNALFARAMPLSLAFLAATTAAVARRYRPGWLGVGAILLTTVVLLALLGLNVSVIGLVEVPRSASYLIAELFALIFILSAVYAAAFALLERRALGGWSSP
jgi:hypothetical protein